MVKLRNFNGLKKWNDGRNEITDILPVPGLNDWLTEVVISVKILGLKFLRYIAVIKAFGGFISSRNQGGLSVLFITYRRQYLTHRPDGGLL